MRDYTVKEALLIDYNIKGKDAKFSRTSYTQGHSMDLFLKISVLQAQFCWLGDVEEIIVLGKKVLLGKR